MRLTSTRDMISAAVLAGAGLMFQLGATFGPDPPPDNRRAPRFDLARPATSPAPSPVIVADFLDQPAPIGQVTVADGEAGARIDLRLGPGRVDPRFSWSERGGAALLKVEGLAVGQPVLGSSAGLVDRWSVDPADAAVFSLRTPARIERVVLDEGSERRLVLHLATCSVAPPRWDRFQIEAKPAAVAALVVPPRVEAPLGGPAPPPPAP